jgi:P27 family predicted phage terminase small subunit
MPGKVKSSPRAAEEWKRLVPILRRMKVLTEADYIALGNLCWDVALLESTQEKMVNTPLLIRTPAGGFKPNPMLGIVSETADRVSRTLREFGLTPASRSNIRREPDDEAGDEWAEF